MPAMSPTMTEGNIASWKVKEGDAFSTGDVLLEIETDKAQMDVEAQDDGVVAKLMQQDGAKGVKVGTRIAVLAERDDDLSNLEIPAEEPSQPIPENESSPNHSPPQESKPKSPTPPSSKTPKDVIQKSPSKPLRQTYPLYPSVQHLLRENSLNLTEADKIPASGPNGRLLKGDVLAYLGNISQSYPSQLSQQITKLSHLDLSNIKLAPPPQARPPPQALRAAAPPLPTKEISVSISLAAVLAVQKRLRETLNVSLPLSEFIKRATFLANDNLPRSRSTALSADELFNSVLGLPITVGTRGNFIPQITALPAKSLHQSRKQPELIDFLARKPTESSRPLLTNPGNALGAQSVNIFSVQAIAGNEKRAKSFLERVKTLLEVEPGLLVITS
ncbi:MAG: pyridoxine biosynthesis protein [Trizodia sp. TS-e1964]|nr:MAG: pyridoxine biosynthesis protein [Trizodia sp. TS-e1964]